MKSKGGQAIKQDSIRVNEEITVAEIRMIDPAGKQFGVVQTQKALEMALSYNLDLVEVAPNAKPPVCRIMDYGKYKYQLSKKEKVSKKKQHVIHVKEIRLRPTIDSHDVATKMRQSRKFLEEGNHVRVRILFRGRQIIHPELGQAVLERVQQELSDIAVMEKEVLSEDKSIVATFIRK